MSVAHAGRGGGGLGRRECRLGRSAIGKRLGVGDPATAPSALRGPHLPTTQQHSSADDNGSI